MIFQKNKKSGFSMTELLTTITILLVLAGIAVPVYQNYTESSIKVSMKTELTELSKALNYAHSVDGGYHHNIFTMGYKPNRQLLADTGFEYARGSKADCGVFPQNASGNFSPFLTITENYLDATKQDSITRASDMCAQGFCSLSNKVVPGALAQQSFSSGHSGCQTEFSQSLKCGCDDFRIYSRSYVRTGKVGTMFANQNGVFGYSDKSGHIEMEQ